MDNGCTIAGGCLVILIIFAVLSFFFHPFGAIVIMLLGAILMSLNSQKD